MAHPRIVLPRDSGRFVQIYIGNEPYLRGGPVEGRHAELLADALHEFKIKFELRRTREDILIPEKAKQRAYSAVGMGLYRILPEKILFDMHSSDYLIGTDENHLRQILPFFPAGVQVEMIKMCHLTPVIIGIGEGKTE